MMGKDSLDCNFEEAESGLFSSTSYVEKKVKLFGFELNPSNNNNNNNLASSSCMKLSSNNCGDQESVNSSTTTVLISTNKSKFQCQFCFKEFTNSQALGGHQNAHKKERLNKKNMQLQATKASLSYHLHPFQTNNLDLYDYSSHSHICFDQNRAESIRFDDQSFSFFPDEERRLFTLTKASVSVSAAAPDSSAGAAMPVGFQFFSNSSSSSLPVFKRNPSCKSLDLQLGLN